MEWSIMSLNMKTLERNNDLSLNETNMFCNVSLDP